MSNSRIPSPARSQAAPPVTPRRYKSRGTRSVGSPARSDVSGRLSSVVDAFKKNNQDSVVLSPLDKTILSDNTEIEMPKRKSWWKKVENSREIILVANDDKTENPNLLDELDVEVLSQEKKNYTLDIPDSSDSESISSMIVPQRRLFTQKENMPQTKFGVVTRPRKSVTNKNKTEIQDKTIIEEKTVHVSPKKLFGQTSLRPKPVFPAALLKISPDKTFADKTKELPEIKNAPRNLFGNRPDSKKRNIFADFILSESDDEIPDIQPRLFTFQKQPALSRRSSAASKRIRDSSPTSSITTDIEIEDWKLLPSSTMVEHQLEAQLATPGKRTRLSKLSEVKESINTNSTKQSDKSVSSKDKNNTLVTPYKENQNLSGNNKSNYHNIDLEKRNISQYEKISKAKELYEITNKSVMQDKAENEDHVENNSEMQDKVENMSKEVDGAIIKSVSQDAEDNEEVDEEENINESEALEDEDDDEEENINESKAREGKDDDEEENMNEIEAREDEDNESIEETEVINENDMQQEENQAINNSEQQDEAENDDEVEKPDISQKDKISKAEELDEIINKSVMQDKAENKDQVENNSDNVGNVIEVVDEVINKSVLQDEEENEDDDEEENMNDSEAREDEENESEEENEVINESDLQNEENEAINNSEQQDEEENEDEGENEIINESEVQEEEEKESGEKSENEENYEEDAVSVEQDAEENENEEHDEEIHESEEAHDEYINEDEEQIKELNASKEMDVTDEIDIDEEAYNDSREENSEQAKSHESEEEEVSDREERVKHQKSTTEMQQSYIENSNNTHDTTGRNRKKLESGTEHSPEAILYEKSAEIDSFTVKGRNTSIRKTKSILKDFSIRPSMAPRDSTGFSDGTENSSAAGSGWDSHRTTRRTLRQTFGKDFTPRKSLRALVMEKSAKRQTMINEANANLKLHPANSTESYDDNEMEVENVEPMESDHEVSLRTRQTTLDMVLQKIQRKNMEWKLQIEENVLKSLKPAPPVRDVFNYKGPSKFAMRRANTKTSVTKPQKRLKPTFIDIENLPPELAEDMKYKPPKRFCPRNASWVTKRLYKSLETKLEPRYGYKARVRAEKFVETLYEFVRSIRRERVAPTLVVSELKKEMARLDIVATHFDFYNFFRDYLPKEVKLKVVPDLINNIQLPREGVFSPILQANELN